MLCQQTKKHQHGQSQLQAASWLIFLLIFSDVLHVYGRIFRHEIGEDGEKRWLSCAGLDDCLEQGISTPGMLMHRSWLFEIEDAMIKRASNAESRNTSAWYARQSYVRALLRKTVLKAAGPRDTPPVRLVRRFQDHERGVAVQLIIFEAWPGHSVPAVIFMPLGVEQVSGSSQRFPAVLHLPGHLAAGLRDPDEQNISLGLAQRGYVVMSFDPISQGERHQYSSESGLECSVSCQPSGDCLSNGPPCSKAHDHFGKQLWLLGQSAAELFVQDAQRALDVLSSLPFVDPTRIGAVGCSGGGMLTAYIGAVDSRIKASAIACYFSTLDKEMEIGTCNYDAEQILWGQAKLGLDKPDFLIARAPKPTVVLLTSHDCFPLDGGRQGFDEAAQAFAAHGMVNGELNLYASEAMGYHQMTQVGFDAVHTLFFEHLGKPRGAGFPGASEALPSGILDAAIPCQKLWFGAEQVASGATGGPSSRIGNLLRQFARPLLQRLRARRRLARGAFGSSWLSSLPQLSARVAGLNIAIATQPSQAASVTLETSPSVSKVRFFARGVEEWYVLPTWHRCAVTVRLFRFTGDAAPDFGSLRGAPIALLFGGGALLNRGLDDRESALFGELHSRGMNLLVAGLCGFGDDLWRGGLWEFAPFLLARTHIGVHAAEVLHVIAWARRALGAGSIVLIAMESAAPAVLHAAVHIVPTARNQPMPLQAHDVVGWNTSALVGVALVRSMTSFSSIALAPRHNMPWNMQMHGVLKHYDIPDLVAALARPGGPAALILEPRGPLDEPINLHAASEAYDLARRRFEAVGRPFRVLAGEQGILEEALAVAAFTSSVACSSGVGCAFQDADFSFAKMLGCCPSVLEEDGPGGDAPETAHRYVHPHLHKDLIQPSALQASMGADDIDFPPGALSLMYDPSGLYDEGAWDELEEQPEVVDLDKDMEWHGSDIGNTLCGRSQFGASHLVGEEGSVRLAASPGVPRPGDGWNAAGVKRTPSGLPDVPATKSTLLMGSGRMEGVGDAHFGAAVPCLEVVQPRTFSRTLRDAKKACASEAGAASIAAIMECVATASDVPSQQRPNSEKWTDRWAAYDPKANRV